MTRVVKEEDAEERIDRLEDFKAGDGDLPEVVVVFSINCDVVADVELFA